MRERLDAASKKSAAGMKVYYDGALIGATADNIFSMINRAYDRKRQDNQFLETLSIEPVVRLPASTAKPKPYKPAAAGQPAARPRSHVSRYTQQQ